MPAKLLSLILFGILSFVAQAQNRKVQFYEKIPPEGLSLTEGWLMTAQDNPEFSKTEVKENGWTPIVPAQDISLLPQLKNIKVGWMRLHFKVGAELSEKALLLSVFQNAASEVYLDGKLIKRYGTISQNPAKVVPVGVNLPLEEIFLNAEKEHVFAVRFSPWQFGFYSKMDNDFFVLSVTDFSNWQNSVTAVNESNQTYTVLLSVFFLLSLLHLSFYRYDPTQRANLYFSWYAVISTITFLMVAMQGSFQDMRLYSLVRLPSFILSLMTGIWSAKALSTLFEFKTSKLIIGMWIVYLASSVSILLWGSGFVNFDSTLILFTLIQIYLLIKALMTSKSGAGIIAAGFGASVVAAAISSAIQYWSIEVDLRWFQAFVGIIYLAPALGISLYLAREFALTSNLLRDKLVQVETLSAQNIAQEQEKQQLLADQNEKLESQVQERTSALSRSLDDLRAAQTQLIQTEKMASLGELTAGIAHEIQNPLNFVNNFSEVSTELIIELEEELNKGDIQEAQYLTNDIKQNLEKINLHGKRADNIVKGMLEHSRTSKGIRELVDIVKLTDEYLRLAYHGIRAKDNTLNVNILKSYPDNLPAVSIIPQDIGRVLLNIFNNAFYAVQQKQKQADTSYIPTIEVAIALIKDHLQISIGDNGMGIPEAIIDKIMQPFFTTKPTGEGTGLGLSLSYDIIVKVHLGKIKISNNSGGGALALIILPNIIE